MENIKLILYKLCIVIICLLSQSQSAFITPYNPTGQQLGLPSVPAQGYPINNYQPGYYNSQPSVRGAFDGLGSMFTNVGIAQGYAANVAISGVFGIIGNLFNSVFGSGQPPLNYGPPGRRPPGRRPPSRDPIDDDLTVQPQDDDDDIDEPDDD